LKVSKYGDGLANRVSGGVQAQRLDNQAINVKRITSFAGEARRRKRSNPRGVCRVAPSAGNLGQWS
jgi:hypothetical protein